ncbi:hypothetical protein ED733_002379 [Metarhizium rileyi]|uniref:Cytochrome P450 n=1 Tax=Metarhizium rileyi (strain RCEF 4871) TaxID=1649241 RepID=A0A5C6G176_METRR|nr:hypothetical protein ED733_002379 [Metarhizium rileyi]
MLHMTYGYAIEPHTFDPLVCLIEKMMENFSDALVPMSWLVDIITPLRFLPSYLPGMSFKATARQWYSTNEEVMRVPFDFVQQQMARGTHRPSFVSSMLQDHTEANENGTLDDATKHTIMSVAGIMYGAGADTTAAVLSAFVLAMILFPEVQDRAQEEIDSTIGGRLPDFEDRENLPYVSAVTMESLRWFPITPINTTHVANTEIQYKGYRIPKGAYLLASNWWLLHNPETYDNPASFDPDRFLVRNEPDPASVVFGYGRRICPGRYVADKSLFITIARLLSAFTISKAASDPSLKFTSGLIAHPEEFEFHIRPRSERHAELVQAIEKDIPWEHGDSRLIDV